MGKFFYRNVLTGRVPKRRRGGKIVPRPRWPRWEGAREGGISMKLPKITRGHKTHPRREKRGQSRPR